MLIWPVLVSIAQAGVATQDNKDFEKQGGSESILQPNSASQNAVVDLTTLPEDKHKYECAGDYSLDSEQNAPNATTTKAKFAVKGTFPQQCKKFSDKEIKNWQQGQTTVVDLRSDDQHAEWHVPGSLNIPEYAVKTKAYLKSKPLVLIDDGLSNAALVSACKTLLATGFKNVSIVEGGARRWKQIVGPKEAKKIVDPMRLITPKQYLTVINEYQWLVVALDVDLTEVKGSFGQSNYAAYSDDGRGLSHQIDQLKRKRGNSNNYRLLVVSQDGENYSKLDGKILESQLGSIYFMNGGLEEYRNYLSMHSTMIAKVNAKPIRRNGCGI